MGARARNASAAMAAARAGPTTRSLHQRAGSEVGSGSGHALKKRKDMREAQVPKDPLQPTQRRLDGNAETARADYSRTLDRGGV